MFPSIQCLSATIMQSYAINLDIQILTLENFRFDLGGNVADILVGHVWAGREAEPPSEKAL